MSLVELLVVVAIMGVVAAAMGSLVSHQANTVNRMENAQEALSHKLVLLQALSQPGVCQSNLATNFQSNVINLNTPTTLDLKALTMASGSNVISLSSPGLQIKPGYWVQKIFINNITQVGTTSQFTGQLNVQMSADKPGTPNPTNAQLRTITLPLQLAATMAGTTATVTDCSAGQLTGGGGGGGGPAFLSQWPANLYCNGAVFTVLRPGVYHGFQGGEKTTRSTVFRFSSTTKKITSVDTGGSGFSPCGGASDCCNKTIDQIKADKNGW